MNIMLDEKNQGGEVYTVCFCFSKRRIYIYIVFLKNTNISITFKGLPIEGSE